MAYNFPNSPALDQIWAPPGGPSWRWNGYGWTEITIATTGIEEAPADGIDYVRKNAAWNVLPVDIASWASITGKPSTFPPDAHTHAYSSLTGIPATFAPTLPIPSSGVTGLDAAQTAQDTAIGTKLNSSAYTAADVLAKLITVDGAGTNLDADLLDGNDSAFFATASSVTGKEPTIAAGTAAQYWQGTKTWQTLDKAAVGLGNVDNTADSAKPVSTAQASADALKVAIAGDTMTGDLSVSKTTPAVNIVKGASGQEGIIAFKTGANLRWTVKSESTAESAGAGSNFIVTRYDDAGAPLSPNPINISRSTGVVTLSDTVALTLSSVGTCRIFNSTAPPAGGAANTAFRMSSTSALGIYFGSGAPTVTAAQGSLYINTTGSSNVTRLYVNTTGSTVWTAVNTVA